MATDESYDIYDFIENFIPNNLGILHGKPKLFFIQACRGIYLDDGHKIISKGQIGTYIHPKFADVLISFSTYYGLNYSTFQINF